VLDATEVAAMYQQRQEKRAYALTISYEGRRDSLEVTFDNTTNEINTAK
jgi:hypothetical protein